ncbi:Hypothetical predicted protein [Xyrichtys novacula]|uniref:Uncharacterized protein n=1 Tax=Xyrichtys novacula TaxID=13765 RepID=A0AAV1GDK3_XYRNO|nr:Hypothetical predicted protein [Xyrichtys novacula]
MVQQANSGIQPVAEAESLPLSATNYLKGQLPVPPVGTSFMCLLCHGSVRHKPQTSMSVKRKQDLAAECPESRQTDRRANNYLSQVAALIVGGWRMSEEGSTRGLLSPEQALANYTLQPPSIDKRGAERDE